MTPSEEASGLRLESESSVRRILQGSWRRVARPRRGAGGRPTNVGYNHRREKPRNDQPPQQPPTQVFAQQRRSGCDTLLVALLVLAIITAIVILLGAFGLLR